MKQLRSMDSCRLTSLQGDEGSTVACPALRVRRASRSWLAPGLTAAIAALGLAFGFHGATPLAQAGNGCGADVKDTDGDGLADLLEDGLGISKNHFDTDGDGWSDSEEIARGSLPAFAASTPGDTPLTVGANAYQSHGKLRFAVATYVRTGSLNNLQLLLGVYAYKKHFALGSKELGASMQTITVPTRVPGQLLVVTDVQIVDTPLARGGSMSIYARLCEGPYLIDADAVDLTRRDGVIVELVGPAQLSPEAEQQLGPGLLQRPLGGAPVPPSWTSGEICFQRLESVGSHGAVVTQEVVASTCVSGWDGYCDAGNCTSSVGRTVDLIDPSALVGG